jgi:predicted outer membrane protein
MQRRSIPLALAGAALLPAMAQAQGNTANNRAPGPGATPQAATPPANLAGMPPAQLAKMTHDAGAFSLATARMGMEKASNAEVKRFANFEVREQEGVAQAMKLAGHNFPEPQFGGEKAQVIQRLQSANGADFDRLFLQVQEQGHQELLNLTTAAAESQAPVPDRITALLASDRIREHLIDIGTLQGRR